MKAMSDEPVRWRGRGRNATFIPPEHKIVSFIEFTEDCWLWTGHCNPKGYGRFRDSLAHRAVYETFVEAVPTDRQLDHLCRVRRCVNPDHLEIVTNATNARRGSMAKLTFEQADAIRGSQEPTHLLAARFGVSCGHVQKIRRGAVWHDTEPAIRPVDGGV